MPKPERPKEKRPKPQKKDPCKNLTGRLKIECEASRKLRPRKPSIQQLPTKLPYKKNIKLLTK